MRPFLRGSRKGLTQEDLSSPIIQRFLTEDLDRLGAENEKLHAMAQSFQALQVRYAVLEESARIAKWTEILSYVGLAIGSAGLGAAPSYLGIAGGNAIGIIIMVLSALLVVGSIIARIAR